MENDKHSTENEKRGEFVSMDDAIESLEADVYTYYLHWFEGYSEAEKIKKLAEKFNISVQEVERIVNE